MKILLQETEIIIDSKLVFENLLEITSIRSLEKTSTLQSEILKQVGEKTILFIENYNDILKYIKLLDPTNIYTFLSLIGTSIEKYVETIDQLSTIISYISDENNKFKLLLFLGVPRLKLLISDANDLGKLLQWLYGYSELLFLKQLGTEFIVKLFSENKEIQLVLNFLSEDGRKFLLDTIGFELIIGKIRNHIELGTILRRLDDEQFNTFLSIMGKTKVQRLFTKQNSLEHFLLRLSSKKESIFLTFLYN